MEITILLWVGIHLTSISTIFEITISNDHLVQDDEVYPRSPMPLDICLTLICVGINFLSEYIVWFKNINLVKVFQGSLIITPTCIRLLHESLKWMYCLVQKHEPYQGLLGLLDNLSTSMNLQSGCIVWFKNMSLVKVFQSSLIVIQHVFDNSTGPQSGCIVWFKNISLVKVLQGSFIVIQHVFDISTNR